MLLICTIIEIKFLSLSQIALRSYTFENVAFHVLHERLPHFSFQTLTEWYSSSDKQLRYVHVKVNWDSWSSENVEVQK